MSTAHRGTAGLAAAAALCAWAAISSSIGCAASDAAPRSCLSDSDCGAAELCVANRCAADGVVRCDDAGDCPTSWSCLDARCVLDTVLVARPGEDGRLFDPSSGVEVLVPAGAVAVETAITVQGRPELRGAPVSGLPPSAGESPVSAFSFGPAGTAFDEPLLIALPAPTGLEGGRLVPVLLYDEAAETWEPARIQAGDLVFGVSSADGTRVTFATDHFSIYGIPGHPTPFTLWEPDYIGNVPILVPSAVYSESGPGGALAWAHLGDAEVRRAGYREILLELVLRTGKERSASEQSLAARFTDALAAFDQWDGAGAPVKAAELEGYVLQLLMVVDTIASYGLTSEHGAMLGELGETLTAATGLVSLTEDALTCAVGALTEAALYSGLDYARALDRWQAVRKTLESSELAERDPAFYLAVSDVGPSLDELRETLSARFEQALSGSIDDCQGFVVGMMERLALPWLLTTVLKLGAVQAAYVVLAYEFVLRDMIFNDVLASRKKGISMGLLATLLEFGGLADRIEADLTVQVTKAVIELTDVPQRERYDRIQLLLYANEAVERQMADVLDASDTSVINRAFKWIDEAILGTDEMRDAHLERADALGEQDAVISGFFADYCGEDTAAVDNPLCTGDYPLPGSCTRSCDPAAECGPDGCGGTCGTCGPSEACEDGACVPTGPCVPACAGRACGEDGCGGSCGACGGGKSCVDGQCVDGPCTPNCADKACGDDGCGGSCGGCSGSEICTDGDCVSPIVYDEMIQIPASTFTMGCVEHPTKECMSDEFPLHTVELSSYKIARYEVTNERYAEFLDDFGNICYNGWADCYWPISVSINKGLKEVDGTWQAVDAYRYHPVRGISWVGAVAFCDWDGGKRPCTEAEWENAAKGGEGRLFPWGSDLPTCEHTAIEQSQTEGCGVGGAGLPVGEAALDVSVYGVHDMAGNVAEWVWDAFDDYPNGPVDDPMGPELGVDSHRVVRGGWVEGSGSPNLDATVPLGYFFRTSFRAHHDPLMGDDSKGVRCCDPTKP